MILESRAADEATTELLEAVRLIAARLQGKFGFRVPLEDVQQECCLTVLLFWRNIDPERNVFGYLTSVVFNEYRKLMRGEGKQTNIRRVLEARLRLTD